jgi:hypothetical protein
VSTKVQPTDILTVNRGGTPYKITGAKFLAGNFQDTDLFLVNRGGVDYKATGALMRAILQRAPVIGTVVLAEEDTKGAAFTSQKFKTTITLTDAGQPAATIGLKATVVAGGVTKYLVFNAAGTVTDMQSADPGFVTMTNSTAPVLTFPATFPSGNAPDVELPNGTTITTVVEAKNTAGAPTKTSNVVTPKRELKPGDAAGGGYYIGQIRMLAAQHNFDTGAPYATNTIYNLIIAPKATGETAAIAYNTSATGEAAGAIAQLLNDGRYITETYNNASHPAFQWAAGLTIAGFTDWYVPARDELEVFYRDLKPNHSTNYTTLDRAQHRGPSGTSSDTDTSNEHGTNLNSVPAGAAYTGAIPTTTTNPLFNPAGSESLASGILWTATERSAGNTSKAWATRFGDGRQVDDQWKSNTNFARAIRRELA